MTTFRDNITNFCKDTIVNITLRGTHYIGVNYKNIPVNFLGILYNFECFKMSPEHGSDFSSIVLLNNITSIHKQEHDYDETGNEIQRNLIDVTDKKYCIELLEKHDELWINFIQNKQADCRLPNMEHTNCVGLGGILKLIFHFLTTIDYDRNIYLHDDSEILGYKTLKSRLLSGGDSIYATYGFVPSNLSADYHERLSNLKEKIIVITPEKPFYKFLKEEHKTLTEIKLKDLASTIKKISNEEEGKQYTSILMNLDSDIKSEIEYVCNPYNKMVNTHYKDYLDCDEQHGGNPYKQKYYKYSKKINQLLKNLKN